ncbi:MAG TPA: carboxypeptidase-like regulatory domain-containing protein [Planctomycetota bacterium]
MKLPLRPALVLGFVLAFVLALAVPWLLRGRPPSAAPAPTVLAPATAPGPGVAPPPEAGPPDMREPVVPAPQPEAAEARAVDGVPAPVAQSGARRVLGRVLDCAGAGVPGVTVGLEGEAAGRRAPVVSGGAGAFELTGELRRGRVVALDDAHVTVLAGALDPESSAEVVVVVARRIVLGGRVIDATGAPLAGVELRVVPRRPLEVSFARTLDGVSSRSWSERSDADGRFAFERAPALPGGALVAGHSGYLPFEMPLFQHDARELLVVLERPERDPRCVRGLVLDADGRAVAGARVAAHPAWTQSDARGRFELRLEPAPLEARLVAVKHGLGACTREVERDAESLEPLWPDPVVLVLDGGLGAVTGRVVDDARAPMAGVRVWLADPTSAGLVGGAPGHAEDLSHGATAGGWSYETTDADGRFRIEGLLARRYRVRALDERTLLAVEVGEVRRGDELELVLPTAGLPGEVAGRVRDARGRVLPGVEVRVTRPTFRGVGENGWAYTDGVMLEPALTDEEGRFELAPFSLEGTFVHLEGEEIFPVRLEVAGQDPAALELVASLRVHVQVELGPPGTWADAFELLDEAGEPVWLTQLRAGRSGVETRAPLHAGRSVVWTVSEAARTLVLYRAGSEVRRQPVSLGPGPVNLLRM